MLASLLLIATTSAAPPKLDALFPAGGQRGQTLELTADGNYDPWPPQVWIEGEGVRIEPAAEKGKFQCVIAENARPGVFWVRMHAAEGATRLRPFLVDSLPELSEQEPNSSPAEAQHCDQSVVVNGRLQKRGDVDGVTVDLSAGQTLVAAVDANWTLDSPVDAVLQICTADGFVLDQNDDARGIDPQIVFVAPRDGRYLVRLFGFPATPDSSVNFAGSNAFIYRLTLTTKGFVDHALPLSMNVGGPTQVQLLGWNLPESTSLLQLGEQPLDAAAVAFHDDACSFVTLAPATGHNVVADAGASLATPQSMALPAVISGCIEEARDEDAFVFAATKGQKLSLSVESDSLGFLLDPLLQLLDAEGKVLAEADDTRRKRDCELNQTIPEDGQYRVVIRDAYRHGGFRYVYRLTIQEPQPDFELTLAADAFVLTPGKPLEIPVTIDRRHGFANEIKVSAVGLPAGVQQEPASSAGKGDSAKSVKLVLRADKGPVSGPIRIVGTGVGEPALTETATFAIGDTSAQHSQAWLTVLQGP